MTDKWPECVKCSAEYNPKRAALGYDTCLDCGSPIKQYVVAPAYNKGGLQLISDADIPSMGKKTAALEE